MGSSRLIKQIQEWNISVSTSGSRNFLCGVYASLIVEKEIAQICLYEGSDLEEAQKVASQASLDDILKAALKWRPIALTQFEATVAWMVVEDPAFPGGKRNKKIYDYDSPRLERLKWVEKVIRAAETGRTAKNAPIKKRQ